MNIFTSRISRILLIVLPVFLVHLNQSYSAPSFKPNEFLEAHSEFLEGHPEILKGPSQGSDGLKFTGGESHTGLPMEETIVQDHLGLNYKPQESAFSQTWNFLSMEKYRSAKKWSRIYDVGELFYPSFNSALDRVIGTVLKIGRQDRPPSSESIGRDLIVPTFLALQDHSLTMLERMWVVGQQSSDPSKHTSLEFERLLQSFINLQIPTKPKDVRSFATDIMNSMHKGKSLGENPSLTPLEMGHLREMLFHLNTHHE
ncbi:hypothetical protein DFH28DRAFT_1052415 [Melampsora americana]|nr:hypothetical protein DFH28DRAFT_1052415 [Melampsora americana]